MKVSRRKRQTPEMDISSGVSRCIAPNVLYQTVAANAGHWLLHGRCLFVLHTEPTFRVL
jgi:hypothetical protein